MAQEPPSQQTPGLIRTALTGDANGIKQKFFYYALGIGTAAALTLGIWNYSQIRRIESTKLESIVQALPDYLAKNPKSAEALAKAIKSHLTQKEPPSLESIIQGLPEFISKNPEYAQALAKALASYFPKAGDDDKKPQYADKIVRATSISDVEGAFRYGLDLKLLENMYKSDPQKFAKSFGLNSDASKQIVHWFDKNLQNGEARELNGIALGVDGIARRSRIYLENDASATFPVNIADAKSFVMAYLKENTSAITQVYILTPGSKS